MRAGVGGKVGSADHQAKSAPKSASSVEKSKQNKHEKRGGGGKA